MEGIKKTKEQEMPHYRTTMSYQLDCLQGQGYNKQFSVVGDKLKCLETGEMIAPDDIEIVEHERFEGISDPDDMAILYAITTKSGLKGTIVGAFGMYADSDLIGFMNKVKDKTIDSISHAAIKKCTD
ncbi:hypothetical protein RCC89_13060 [Cytophagaceae bacterium ABcell3]|nr:hypothetical protein RCC89_13060 [Cytophagaceae bacterium ABcell3]